MELYIVKQRAYNIRENPNSHVTPSIKTGYFIILAICQTVLKIQKYNEHELKCKLSGLIKILD